MAKVENGHLKGATPQGSQDDAGCGGKCWRWLKSEFYIKKEMLPIKILVLTISGGMVSFLPFLTVHMRSLGIRPQEIGIILAILPIPSFIGPLLAERIFY
ncbi:unnamed protein product [Meganyctiphanes norvegica]|uniref:Major facilitator superfamily associated domain-containing protein n=1 Tax=Meganyctiphanes norvegica TaxID=48144 RepID=A0AAV2Q6J0_MEGNR